MTCLVLYQLLFLSNLCTTSWCTNRCCMDMTRFINDVLTFHLRPPEKINDLHTWLYDDDDDRHHDNDHHHARDSQAHRDREGLSVSSYVSSISSPLSSRILREKLKHNLISFSCVLLPFIISSEWYNFSSLTMSPSLFLNHFTFHIASPVCPHNTVSPISDFCPFTLSLSLFFYTQLLPVESSRHSEWKKEQNITLRDVS